jgi:hypothetical protein
MSNSNFQNAYLASVAEDNPGQTPSSPVMSRIRTTDPLNITADKQVIGSEQPYNHRQNTLNRHGLKAVSGGVPFEFSPDSFDEWLESLMGGQWTDEDPGTPEVLKIGNAIKTFTVERGFPDISVFERFKGVIPNQMTLNIPATGLTNGNFDVIGMDHDEPATEALGSPQDVSTLEPFDGMGMATIHEGGETSGDEIGHVTSLEMTINMNRNIDPLVGSYAGDEPVNGQAQVQGTLTARFRSKALLDKFYSGAESLLKVRLTHSDSDKWIEFLFPRIAYNGGNRQQSNNALDVSLPFVALYDAGESTSLTITRSNPA